jgi:hypothetical protein
LPGNWWALEDLNLRPLPCQGRIVQVCYLRESENRRWERVSTRLMYAPRGLLCGWSVSILFQMVGGACDDDAPVLERLTETLDGVATEPRELVEEQDAMMRETA